MSKFDKIAVLNKIGSTGMVPVFYHKDAEVAKKVVWIDFVLPRAARPSHNGRVPAKSMNKRNPLFTRILFHFSGVRELACRRSGKIKRLRICRNLFYL